MGTILLGIGTISFVGYLIWLIVCIRNWDSKIPSIIGMILSVVMIVGGASDVPIQESKTASAEPSTQEDAGLKSDNGKNQKESEGKDKESIFSIGEPVNLNDVIVTLVDVRESEGSEFMAPEDGKTFILCEFEIENDSKKDITVSSMLSFEAYVDEYSFSTDLSATISSEKQQLDGTIASGKKMNGEIGYQAPKDWEKIEIRFTPDFWSGKDIKFVYNK